ncbi:LOW QUALITY PROTEIN: all trans-polyprenyl-diphosphate synthase PDSS1-like [Physella acuta]|uniref:LOW QUALITY PROTEIN: all trans-polyprenyl-diphosphate synthase PDSS1-like n=1 Tax=Physella acuta TaxID=109671 RepID=UPI0027DD1163|nr:LOW QUALITY PROTEIN: all trans-polyprenyl-diphosphate synthase PDSS1-like [Physella acuta]
MVAIVSEMIHTASLVHDDVIDASDTRRGEGASSLNKMYGQRKSILVGDYIVYQASIALASRTDNPRVITILSSLLEDLVSGEFMQLGSKEDENERFSHYLMKTYKKTASRLANTCKAVAVLGDDERISELAYQYGRNLGIAFQLVDDLLDFISSESIMGKPTAADLKLGLTTTPVLFAAQEFPELHPMIMRRFSQVGDVEQAREFVAEADGVEQTKLLALHHSREAVNMLKDFALSDAQRAVIKLAQILLDRKS